MRDTAFLERLGIQPSTFGDGPVAVLDRDPMNESTSQGFDLETFAPEERFDRESFETQERPAGESSRNAEMSQAKNSSAVQAQTIHPPREVCRLIAGLIAESFERIGTFWHRLEPDWEFVDRVNEVAMDALHPPYTREKLDAFKRLLAEWESAGRDRVNRWIETARTRTDQWPVVRCRLCEWRIGDLMKGGVRREKAIQIAFSEMNDESRNELKRPHEGIAC